MLYIACYDQDIMVVFVGVGGQYKCLGGVWCCSWFVDGMDEQCNWFGIYIDSDDCYFCVQSEYKQGIVMINESVVYIWLYSSFFRL